ncbi:hypothetical protein ACFL2D_00130 [Patescibacteria group bacterium]
MMTFGEANDLVAPIMKTELYRKSERLQAKADEVRKLCSRYDSSTHPFGLIREQVLHEDVEAGFREIISLYEELSGERKVGNEGKTTADTS